MERAQSYFFFGFLGIIAIIAFLIALPYLPAIIFAATLAVIFKPLHEWLQKAAGGRAGLAAWLTLAVVALVIFIPLASIGFQVLEEARGLYSHVSEQGLSGLAAGEQVKEMLGRISPKLSENSEDLTRRVLDWTLQNAGSVFGNILTAFLNVFICFFALYYFLAAGRKIYDWFLVFSPLPEKYDRLILDRLASTMNSVIRGTLVVVVIQGILAGIGFAIFGVPNSALWGSLTAITGLIPGIGTSLVLIPAIIYTFAFGTLFQAVGLTIWSVVVVGLVDNFMRPYLMRKGTSIHPFAIFIAVIGGLTLFGPLGFIIGPLVFSLLFTLLDIYSSTRLSTPAAPKTRKK